MNLICVGLELGSFEEILKHVQNDNLTINVMVT